MAQWAECPFRHKLKYIDKIDLSEENPHFAFGTAIHAACEDYLKTRVMKSEIAVKILEEEWEKWKDLESFKKAKRDDFFKWLHAILPEVPAFMDANFEEWECITAEEPLYEPIDNYPTKFKGYIDCTIKAKDKKGKELIWILDWKTCSWGWTLEKKTDLMTKAQLVLYKNYWSKKHNIDPKDIRCGFILLKKTAKAGQKCELYAVSVGDVTTQRSLEVVNNMLTALDKNFKFKNRTNCDRCDYHQTDHCRWASV